MLAAPGIGPARADPVSTHMSGAYGPTMSIFDPAPEPDTERAAAGDDGDASAEASAQDPGPRNRSLKPQHIESQPPSR